jgi:hypothetical protein
MLEAVRQRVSQGRFLRDDTHRTRPEATNEFFTVNISVQDEGTSTPSRIRLLIRASDAFVVGWLNENEGIFTSLEEGVPTIEGASKSVPAGFNGSYGSLEGRSDSRAKISLSPDAARQAVRDLSRSRSTEAQQARGLIVLIQAISEAARFDPVEELFRNTYTGPAVTPPAHILTLENSWQNMSEIANREVNNPNDPLTQELMRRHQNMLDQLEIFNSRSLVTTLLGLALFISL